MATRNTEVFNLRCSGEFMAAITEAAARKNLTQSEFARRAIAQHIERTGVKPPQAPRTRKSR
ncbi:ribbon-helix-helix protein, CopG family [Xanthobacter autotrophicus]|uniref:ribbon-helix-helix protein, CopG family n=1 Tax=Xanthobacter autotrophicus TaxID=280 RepID=UPI0024A705DE|nr:ribbon-helix-helix protein, CopG family [Xanthobacter autotrophicus]MDI4655525.1 ribbon-helix-helix domain-containing protein [Xanthobacter autotrophicus]